MFRRLLIPGCLLLLIGASFSSAQEGPAGPARGAMRRAAPPGVEISYSSSRQFTSRAEPRTGWLPHLGSATNIVRLERSLLAVSCERVKSAVLTSLGLPDQWHDRIAIELHPARRLDEVIVVHSILSGAGWSYRVELPDTLERERLTAALVEVVLREIANRKSTGRNVEIPAWLSLGLARELLQSATTDLILDPPNQSQRGVSFNPVLRDRQHADHLAHSRQQLARRPPLTFTELSWPADDQLVGDALESFRSSAQFFLAALLALPGGANDLQHFLELLPSHLNWQISFLKAFQKRFRTSLELEKWWALQVVDFTAREMGETWPPELSWQKFEEILHTPVEIRTRPEELPLRTEMSLQTIIAQWDPARQEGVLEEKVRQLGILRTRVARDLVPLVDAYRQVLSEFLAARGPLPNTLASHNQARQAAASHGPQTLRELDQLDARRSQLRQTTIVQTGISGGAKGR